MAIKIIKEGNKKKVFEGWCRYCGCEFEYEKEDLKESFYDHEKGVPIILSNAPIAA